METGADRAQLIQTCNRWVLLHARDVAAASQEFALTQFAISEEVKGILANLTHDRAMHIATAIQTPIWDLRFGRNTELWRRMANYESGGDTWKSIINDHLRLLALCQGGAI